MNAQKVHLMAVLYMWRKSLVLLLQSAVLLTQFTSSTQLIYLITGTVKDKNLAMQKQGGRILLFYVRGKSHQKKLVKVKFILWSTYFQMGEEKCKEVVS